MNVPSTFWGIVGLIVLALVAVYVFTNIVMPLLNKITMSRLARLFRRIFPPDCAECGRYWDRRMLGNYWHADDCSFTRPPRFPHDDADE